MVTTRLYIPNKQGQKLAAYIDEPAGSEPIAFAVFAHCFTCSKDLKAIANINNSLTNHGISCIRFDMTGIGESEGDFTVTNFTSQLEDFDAVCKFLDINYEAPKLVIGHSLGGAVAIISSMRNSYIKAVATIAAPSEPSKLSLKLRKTREQALREGNAVRDIGGVKLKFSNQFFDDIEQYRMLQRLRQLNKPLLIMHSPSDTYSDYSNAEEIYRAASQPKSLISLDNIDHLMLRKSDANWVGELIANWAKKYIFV